jgi:uncharacterized protein YaaR (DUF327 family)
VLPFIGRTEEKNSITAKNMYFTIVKNYHSKLSDLKEQMLRQKMPEAFQKK